MSKTCGTWLTGFLAIFWHYSRGNPYSSNVRWWWHACDPSAPVPVPVPVTPSLIKALNRIAVAQQEGFRLSHGHGHGEDVYGAGHGKKEGEPWDEFWREVKKKTMTTTCWSWDEGGFGKMYAPTDLATWFDLEFFCFNLSTFSFLYVCTWRPPDDAHTTWMPFFIYTFYDPFLCFIGYNRLNYILNKAGNPTTSKLESHCKDK